MTSRANAESEALDPWTIPLVGTSFIEASAGTGKTYALTTLYLRLLIEFGLRPADILVVTFTQAATAELRERIRARIRDTLATPAKGAAGETALRRALQTFDEAAIFTIHGFCQRTLQESAFESGLAFDAELVEKPELLKRTLAHDLWTRLLADEDDWFREWLAAGAGRRWEFEPAALYHLIHDHLGADPTMPVLPDPGSEDPVPADPRAVAAASKALCDAVDAAWRAFAECWALRRDAVSRLLLDPAVGFNGNKYRPDSIRKSWLPELDECRREVEQAATTAVRAGIDKPEFLKRLTLAGIADGMKKGFEPPVDPFFDLCSALERATTALDEAFNARALALRRRFVAEARAAEHRRRSEQHVLFFDDLLSQLRDALVAPGGERLSEALRARYRFALIDEFQDTDAVQYEIFARVWQADAVRKSGGGLVLIGDPKQAIYSFRGADIQTYLAARADAGSAVHSLGVNHRSDPAVIDAVNALFGATRDPFAPAAIEYRPVTPADAPERPPFKADALFRAGLRVSFLAREAATAACPEAVDDEGVIPLRVARTRWMQALARDVAELLESGATIGGRPIAPSDIAILARRKLELDAARRALEGLGIPCVSRGDGNVFDSREAWELSSVLSAWTHPGDLGRLRAALSSGAHGFDARALAGLADDSIELATFAERFAEYGRLWSQSGFSRAFETWRTREGVTERLLAFQDGDRRLTNWLHLAELLARVASARGPSRSGLVAWLDRAMRDETLRLELGSEASLLRLERDDEAVQLVTLHGSKGLEYEIVYLPSLWESFERRGASTESVEKGGKRPPVRFANPKSNGRRTLDLGVLDDSYTEHLALGKLETNAEQMRLLYVGLTRAKRQCVVFWGRAGRDYGKSPLARLLFGAKLENGEVTAEGFAGWVKKNVDDDGWRAAWLELAARAPRGAIVVEDSDLRSRGAFRPPSADAVGLEFEAAAPLDLRVLATTSFSGLVRGAHRPTAVVAGPLATGRDLDAQLDEAQQVEDIAADLAGDMQTFPRGTEAGTLLHDVLEQCDFAAFDESKVRRLAEACLGRSALGRSALDRELASQIVHVVRSVAHTPLRRSPRPFRLADVAPGQLLPELEFTLAAPGDERGRGFSAAALARILAEAPAGSPLARYADRAAALSWPVLAGFLRGFIDAVFCDGERYFVIDYKSNHLGPRQVDYRPDRLVLPMIQHDYVLQYLLYTVAVDRHLASRIADYDYERHFGGAYYLFLRGMAESHESGCGIFFDRPDQETVHRVSALLGAATGEGR